MTIGDAIKALTDEAQRLGSDANDSKGIVRELVTRHGLGFNAWFVVCCEIADRNAQAKGFKNQGERAAHFIKSRSVLNADRYFRA